MRLLISFAALFLSVFLLQVSSGAVGPLDALSGLTLGFGTDQIGLMGSMHFLGFFIGCWWAPRLMGEIGHSRSFATFTALGAIGLLLHMMVVDARWWYLFRIASGLCIAGCYTVIESWLQAKLTNQNRGRTMGIYRFVDLSGAMIAQLLIGVLEPAAYVSYNLLAIICCASLLPLALTRVPQPALPSAPRLRPLNVLRQSPLAAGAVVTAGITAASFRMVGPIYGAQVGLAADQIAYFLALCVFGGAIAQYPLGYIADKFDRRFVLIGLSIAATAACALTTATASFGTLAVMGAAFLFGFCTFPIFSVAAAHAHDFVADNKRVELSAALMFWYAVGATLSPLISSRLMDSYGPEALFAFISVSHITLVALGLARMALGPMATSRTRYVYTPRTTFTVGRWLGERRSKKDLP